jgi:predicted dienelactone hydrolase
MNNTRRFCLLLAALLSIALSACSGEVELPPAEPLSGDRAAIEQLPGASNGPHEVAAIRGVKLPENDVSRALELNLYFPAAGENFPLLLFSHGNWSDRNSYDRIIEHWVSHGYTVIAADHADCCSPVKGILNSLRYGQYGLIEQRVLDLRRLLLDIPQLEQQAESFAGKADTSRVAITGHSFGAFSAQQFGGAAPLNPDSDSYAPEVDPSVRAILALNPPGPMFDTITERSWDQLTTPTLVSTGTWDIQPSFWPDWKMHLMSHENSLPGDKYALVIQGADHYFGNLICRTGREHEPQQDAFTMLKIATTAFLDHYLKDGDKALLDSDTLASLSNNFAVISRR